MKDATLLIMHSSLVPVPLGPNERASRLGVARLVTPHPSRGQWRRSDDRFAQTNVLARG